MAVAAGDYSSSGPEAGSNGAAEPGDYSIGVWDCSRAFVGRAAEVAGHTPAAGRGRNRSD